MTPAIRLLQRERVAFTQHPYEHDPDADSYGEEAAEKLGVEPARLFKTLICEADGLVMVLVPAVARLDLKALAKALGVKKVDLAEPEAAERATGYVVGGISPLGGRKLLPTLIDESVLTHPTVFVSAGRRGLQVELVPEDLIRLTQASTAAVATQTRPGGE
jgi:Cys-tRNA(Pro)/Cys-tRNA(Cys) deacylase